MPWLVIVALRAYAGVWSNLNTRETHKLFINVNNYVDFVNWTCVDKLFGLTLNISSVIGLDVKAKEIVP